MSSRSLFFFNDTATTEIYTLSLHDALPISDRADFANWGQLHDNPRRHPGSRGAQGGVGTRCSVGYSPDRKSTRLNSSHANISYAVFCLKKNKIYPPPDSPIKLNS